MKQQKVAFKNQNKVEKSVMHYSKHIYFIWVSEGAMPFQSKDGIHTNFSCNIHETEKD
jgi:hypothetical protein